MKLHTKLIALLALSLPAVGPASAAAADGPLARFWRSVVNDTVQSNIWPRPYTATDQIAVNSPFCAMVANGWRMQNTLDAHHFREDTNELLEAGQLKVREILTQNVTYRTIFVLSADRPEDTFARIEAVRAFAMQAVPGAPVEVLETTFKPRGTPAEAIDDVRTRFRNSTPDPRLPQQLSEESP